MLCVLFCSCLKYYRIQNKYLAWAIISIALITTASDLLFAITFTVPFIFTIVICSRNSLINSKKHRVFLGLLFIASLVGYIYNKYFDPLGATASIKLKPTKAITSIESLLSSLWQMPLDQKVFMSVTIFLPLCYLAWHLKVASSKITSDVEDGFNNLNKRSFLASLFVITSCVTNLAAVIILGKYTGISEARYLITLYYMPGLMALLLISLQFERAKIRYKISTILLPLPPLA